MSETEQSGADLDFELDEYADLHSAIIGAGGYKAVAVELFPDLTIHKGAERLHDCVNAGRRDKLAWPEIKWIFAEAPRRGRHQGKHLFDAETGYRASDPYTLEEQQSDLVLAMSAAVTEAQQRVASMAAKLERLNTAGRRRPGK